MAGEKGIANAGDQVQSLGQEDTLKLEMATCSSILALERMVGYSSSFSPQNLYTSW